MDNAEVENRSVLAWDDKSGINYGEDNQPTALDDANAEKLKCGAVDRQSTQEVEALTEVVETTTEHPAPMPSNDVPAPNVKDSQISADIISVAGMQEAEDVSGEALQAGVGSGDPGSAVNEASALINDHADNLPAEQVWGNSAEDDNIRRAVGLSRDYGPVASVVEPVSCLDTGKQENVAESAEVVLKLVNIPTEEEASDGILRAKDSAGGSILVAAEPGGVTIDAQRADTAVDTVKELIIAHGIDLRQERGQHNSSASGAPTDKAVNVTEDQEENEADPEEALSTNTLADEPVGEALPLNAEPCASSTAQPTDGSAEQLAVSTVGGEEEKQFVARVAEANATNVLSPDVIKKDSPTVTESAEGTERTPSSTEDIPGSSLEGDTASFVPGKVSADEPPPGASVGEESPAPEVNRVLHMKVGLALSANEEGSLAAGECIEGFVETANAARSPLVEDTAPVVAGGSLLVVDKQVSCLLYTSPSPRD